MAFCYNLQSLPAVHRVATPFAFGFSSCCPTPHASLLKNRIQEVTYIGSPYRTSVERITTPSRHWCTTAVSHPLATRATGKGCSMEEAVGVVIVDHGSKRAEANEMLEEFASMYRNSSKYQIVEIAHMELAEPSIGTAIAKLASAGCRTAVIAPYFLSRGRHITSDIPALVAEAQVAHPEVRCIIAEPIGLDPLMAQIIESRVTGALQTSL